MVVIMIKSCDDDGNDCDGGDGGGAGSDGGNDYE